MRPSQYGTYMSNLRKVYRGSHTLTHGAFKAALPRQGGMIHIGSESSIMFKRSICPEIKHVQLYLFDLNSDGRTFMLKNLCD